jgi:hypothetical protein
MARKQSNRFADEEPDFDSSDQAAPAAASGNRGLMIGLVVGGGAVLLLSCCVCGSGVGFGVYRYAGSSSTGGDGTKAGDAKKLTDANFAQVKTGMTLEEVEGILGKGSSTTQQELYNLWQHKEHTSAQVDRVILFSITRWYVWTNGNMFLAVGLSPTRSRTDRVSVIVYRDSHGGITARGGDPESRP